MLWGLKEGRQPINFFYAEFLPPFSFHGSCRMNTVGKFAKELGGHVIAISGIALGGIAVGNVAALGFQVSDVLQTHVSYQVDKLKPRKVQ